jgi:hypothetical protein
MGSAGGPGKSIRATGGFSSGTLRLLEAVVDGPVNILILFFFFCGLEQGEDSVEDGTSCTFSF